MNSMDEGNHEQELENMFGDFKDELMKEEIAKNYSTNQHYKKTLALQLDNINENGLENCAV